MASKRKPRKLKKKPTVRECSAELSRIVKRGMQGEDHYKLWSEFKRKCLRK